MAPKKKQQKQQSTSKSSQASKSKTKSQSSGSGPRLQISAENENRLRRLLLNSDRSTQPSSAAVAAQDTLTKSQKAKKLKSIYESLSCEGFPDDQIELALSSLKDNASFESALDWLCLNIPGNELPLKFASATSLSTNEGSVTVLLTSKDDEVPSVAPTTKHKEDMDRIMVRNKHLDEDNQLDSCQPSQADWIRQYMEQQEEDESGTWEDEAENGVFSNKRDSEPRSYDIIAQEYHAARLEASKAKEKGDKKGQEQAGHAIRKLKKELSALGLSDYVLAKEFEREHASFSGSKDAVSSSTITEHHNEGMTLPDSECGSALLAQADKLLLSGKEVENLSSEELPDKPVSSTILGEGKTVLEDDGDDGLCNFFFDDDASNKALPPTVLELQKAERMKELYSKENFEKLDGIWKKGEAKKIPKALLHQLCQKSGWDAPKFSKVDSRKGFSYAVSILRKASGRGKSRKAGGLVTIQLPDQIENFNSVEDAQNMVAAFSIHQLFPDLPLYLAIAEPYASLLLQWKEGGSSNNVEDTLKDRRSGFVDRLLNAESSIATGVLDAADSVRSNLSVEEANTSTNDTAANPVERKTNLTNDVESSYLRNEQENKLKTQRYKEMLKTRASLPIHSLKGDILCKLKEHDVLVVCGETGSGKTTQVPQFILDDMIESGKGGSCNIICTQPRRIAAISVAERVADERCEPSPGSVGSLIGYQVRLDSARNERTKLLFCTTGILLRKLAGDRNLTGVTHILVDEVHERSILGDFLLIVLKNLIEKQSAHGTRKLKVILMSATVDSKLFSNYFGHCPVLNAQGRTHPVTTYFLEDIYEDINYRLASDSSAALRNETSAFNKGGTVNNRRGKKNLVLSSWGDDSLLSEDLINPHYVASNYQSYSKQTNDNLKRLNEDIIDYDLLEDLICHVDETCDEGAILVFLPGVSEIYALHDQLAASYRFGGVSADWILPLHSSIASTDQKKVFWRPPENIRKIIIATNIAETSITIDDVVYVIDCGKHKENRYNPQKKLSSMVEDWISKANARQRRGRAGRVKPGICFCLYTRHRFEKIMRPYQTPEMLRMPLVELCLQIKVLSLGHIKPFLSEALEPPTEETMARAISSLYEVGALEGDEELTPLGHHLAKLPVDVLVGKMMLYGAVFGCLSPILSIAAFLSYKSPFVYPKDEKQNVERAKMSLFTNTVGGLGDANGWDRQSDHLLMIIAYRKWEKILRENGDGAAQQFCNSYFLSSSVMYMIRDMRIQFATLLADIGLINLPKKIVGQKKDIVDSWLSDKSQKFNLYSHHSSIVKAILCAGLYPNVAATEDGIAERTLNSIKHSSNPAAKQVWYDGRREVHVHPSSINSNLKTFRHPFLVFLEKVETSKVFLRDTTIVSPFSIILFGGTINIQHQAGLVIVDEWLKLTAPAQSAVLFKEFRSTLRSLLNKLIRKPENAGVVDNDVVRSMIQLLLDEDK